MATYQFTVYLTGYGETEEEAWNNAVEAFMLDPGEPDEVELEEEEE